MNKLQKAKRLHYPSSLISLICTKSISSIVWDRNQLFIQFLKMAVIIGNQNGLKRESVKSVTQLQKLANKDPMVQFEKNCTS